MNRLSGDHAGHTDCGAAFSVPGNRRAVGESSARIQMPSRPSGAAAANATRRPSGETEKSLTKRICVTGISKRTSAGGGGDGRL